MMILLFVGLAPRCWCVQGVGTVRVSGGGSIVMQCNDLAMVDDLIRPLIILILLALAWSTTVSASRLSSMRKRASELQIFPPP
jgi:hypothetical protein